MRSRVKPSGKRYWKQVLAWVTLGPLGCAVLAMGYMALAFRGFDEGSYRQALVSALVLPILMGVPLFLVFSLKLVELARANGVLKVMAATDDLTGCLNRSAFTLGVEARIDRMLPARGRARGALLIIDADHFKAINDRYGHHVGDKALAAIAQSIRRSVRGGDVVGRLGGEEFGVFLPDADRHGAERVAERLRCNVETAGFAPDDTPCPLSVSVGGVVFDRDARFEDLFRQADARLYEAKRNGRNRIMLDTFTADIGHALSV